MIRRHSPDFELLPALSNHSAGAIDRRRLIGLSAGLGLTTFASHLAFGTTSPAIARQQQDATASATTFLWLLDAPDALRPEAPGSPTDAEINELIDFQGRRSDESNALVEKWGGRGAVIPWLELGSTAITDRFPPSLFEVRAESLLRTAVHDAVVAVLDAQAAHARPTPAATDDRITPIDPGDSNGSSFPSIHAAVAGAASTVLAYVVPDASADGFAGLAEEAATSRLWAGAAFRSDIEAGLALGRAVGELAVARGQDDGSDAVWDGSGWPEGDGYYVRTPPEFPDPAVPLAGTWKTWVLPSGDAIRPAPFPAYGSLGWNAEVAGIRRAVEGRTPAQERIIDYWLSKGPNGYFTASAIDLIERGSLSDVDAANVLAMTSVAMYDALVAVWDAKFTYWVARPISIVPDLNLYIPTPPYPSYPGGFGAAAGAGAAVLAAVFPEAEVDLLAAAVEAGVQRGWSGIHYVLDDDVGVLMGCQVGRMTIGLVRGDGT